jgi:hypothetical protein
VLNRGKHGSRFAACARRRCEREFIIARTCLHVRTASYAFSGASLSLATGVAFYFLRFSHSV